MREPSPTTTFFHYYPGGPRRLRSRFFLEPEPLGAPSPPAKKIIIFLFHYYPGGARRLRSWFFLELEPLGAASPQPGKAAMSRAWWNLFVRASMPPMFFSGAKRADILYTPRARRSRMGTAKAAREYGLHHGLALRAPSGAS